MKMEPITFPARPLDGRDLTVAGTKFGKWMVSAKYNGWRALIHTPTQTVFNRRGQEMSIAGEFEIALSLLPPELEWLDCEGLERRHNLARGTLIVLDLVVPRVPALERYEILKQHFQPIPPSTIPGENEVRLAEQVINPPSLELWSELQKINSQLGCDFYEGVVFKLANSAYPIQRANQESVCKTWCKHRWPY